MQQAGLTTVRQSRLLGHVSGRGNPGTLNAMHTLKRLKGGLLVAVLCAVAGGPWTPASALAQDAPPALDAQTAQPPDTVPPDIARPAGLAITAADAAGTVVAYPVPTATDAVDGPCRSPASPHPARSSRSVRRS